MDKQQLELPLFEQWLPIEGYEELYQISNFGRVKSLNYNHTKQERILKPSTNQYGYQQVHLCKDGKQKMLSVHRLVANAFIPNFNNLPQVNHIDEVKTNNHVSNLEWCDCKYNCNYGSFIEKHSGENNSKTMFGKFGKDNPTSKKVIQLTLNNEVVKIWDCMRDVQRKLGYHQSSISQCCKGKQKTSNGYKWQYA